VIDQKKKKRENLPRGDGKQEKNSQQISIISGSSLFVELVGNSRFEIG
jgi:hypothetical protein